MNPETGASRLDSVEDERQFEAPDVEEKVTSPDSNRKILEKLKRYATEHEQQHGRFPKILVLDQEVGSGQELRPRVAIPMTWEATDEFWYLA